MENFDALVGFVSRTKDGWTAKTETPLENNRILTISTRRNTYGQLVSNASVSTIVENGMVCHVFSTRPGRGDFSANLLANTVTRITEKAVRLQHETALAMAEVDGLKTRIANHYAQQAANQIPSVGLAEAA
ncbi:MAG: hypothetical protein LBV49_10835 [Azonexus sp.]|jgi:hypothetical protein|nr:hypothetical protein [Azonexus sp.]